MDHRTKIYVASLVTLVAISVFSYALGKTLFYSSVDETSLPDNEIASTTTGIMLPESQTSATGTTVSKSYVGSKPTDQGELPVRMSIPALRIDTNVQHVGIGKSGSMAVPTNYTDVGWYRYGTIPGREGSAVFDGHVDNGLALAGVFKHLEDIKPGDDIFVTAENGNRSHFLVSLVDVYDYKEVPTNIIFNENDAALIRLITCEGAWISGEKTYNKRLVVTAVLAD